MARLLLPLFESVISAVLNDEETAGFLHPNERSFLEIIRARIDEKCRAERW